MISKFHLIVFLSLLVQFSFAQIALTPQGSPTHEIVNRFEIKYSFAQNYHSAIRPYRRSDIMEAVDTLIHRKYLFSKKDAHLLRYLFLDNNEFFTEVTGDLYLEADEYAFPPYEKSKRPVLRYFYRTPANFYELDKPGFYAKINPLIHFKAGSDILREDFLFQNTRGIEIRGGIDKKVFFYSNILESQASFPEHVRRRIEKDTIIPGQAFYKRYDSQLFGEGVGYDYLNAQAYIGANLTKNIQFTFGHGKNFIGNGHRSLLLSDYSHNYLHLRINTKLWHFHYQNIFMELAATSSIASPGDIPLPKKYAAVHYLSYKHNQLFEIGLFEAVIFNRDQDFALSYFNPVILYRAVEQFEDSADNVLIGLNANVNLFKSVKLYGQLMLDEFHLEHLIIKADGWHGNKWGIQLGAWYMDMAGIDNLDIQFEWNRIRPYTYSHSAELSYSHYNQPLAHPLGANFNELIFRAAYPITKSLSIKGSVSYANYGDDMLVDSIPLSTNFGGNILRPQSEYGFEQGFGNTIAQGVSTKILNARLSFTYRLAHNVCFDLEGYYRNLNSKIDEIDLESAIIQAGIRVNLWNQQIDY